MLDTHARRYVDPVLTAVARTLHQAGLSANAVTISAMLVGVAAAGLVAAGCTWSGIGLLWLSGLLDASDGALARMTQATPMGAIMDITFDRVVELSIIAALAWRFPEARFALVVLSSTIAVAMSLFLSIAAALRNHTVKSFHYAPGLGERTEAFVCLSLMAADAAHLLFWIWVFVAMMVFTMYQRVEHTRKMLSTEP